jgi:hypothetical protein
MYEGFEYDKAIAYLLMISFRIAVLPPCAISMK